VDLGGRFRRVGGRVVFAFGKHRGRSLDAVAEEDPAYLEWMKRSGLLPDARSLAEQALARHRGQRTGFTT
jgi:DNA polymerase III subunit epsilon